MSKCSICGSDMPAADVDLCRTCAGMVDATRAVEHVQSPPAPSATRRPRRRIWLLAIVPAALILGAILWFNQSRRAEVRSIVDQAERLEKSDPARARERYLEALKLHPDSGRARKGLDRIEAQLRAMLAEAESSDPAKGRGLYESVLAIDPSNDRARHGLARLIEAEEKLKKLLADARARLELKAESYEKALADSEEAEKMLKEAAGLVPGSAEPSYWLGIVFSRRGRSEAAHEALNRALELDPHHRDALSAKGHLLVTDHLLLALDREVMPQITRALQDRLAREQGGAMDRIVARLGAGSPESRAAAAAARLARGEFSKIDAADMPAAMQAAIRYLAGGELRGEWAELLSRGEPWSEHIGVWAAAIQQMEREGRPGRILQAVYLRQPIHAGVLRMVARSNESMRAGVALTRAAAVAPEYLQVRVARAKLMTEVGDAGAREEIEAARSLGRTLGLGDAALGEIK